MKRKTRQRQAKEAALARKEAAGDFTHLQNKKGEMIHKPLAQPTLPKVILEDDEPVIGRQWNNEYKSDYAPSITGSQAADFPPMPVYDAYAPQPQYHSDYPHSQYGEDSSIYDPNTPQASNTHLGYPMQSQADLLRSASPANTYYSSPGESDHHHQYQHSQQQSHNQQQDGYFHDGGHRGNNHAT